MEHLEAAIPEHIREVERLVRSEGKTLRANITGALYELKCNTMGIGGYEYELIEKRVNPSQQVTILLDENLDIIPVSRCDPDNTLAPENVHYIVTVMLNIYKQTHDNK